MFATHQPRGGGGWASGRFPTACSSILWVRRLLGWSVRRYSSRVPHALEEQRISHQSNDLRAMFPLAAAMFSV
ncbi:unnamed protein product [Ectocarpus fasciculatus]